MANNFKFKLNFAVPCNYVFTQVHGGEIGQAFFTDEQLERYAEYIKNVLSQQTEERAHVVTIYGGDLSANIPQLKTFLGALWDKTTGKSFIHNLSIDAEISQIQPNISELVKVLDDSPIGNRSWVVCKTPLVDMRDEEVYALRYMLSMDFSRVVSVALTPANLHRVAEVFQQFLAWREKYERLHCELYIDEAAPEIADSEFDEEFIRQMLQSIQTMLEADTSGKLIEAFVYRPAPALRGVRTGDALMADVMCDMTDGGVVYPGYDVCLLTDRGRDELAVGNIADEFSALDAGRKALFDQLDESGDGLTGTCEDMTRAVPWKDPEHLYSMVPSAQLCKMHELLSEYLPYRSRQHNDDNFA